METANKSFKVSFDEKITITNMQEERLDFSNGWWIESDWSHECCEYNYADFEALKDTQIDGSYFNTIRIECDSDMLGVKINGEFVPFYSQQNGYYSNAIRINVYNSERRLEFTYHSYAELI